MCEESSNLFNFLLCHESDACLNEDEEETKIQQDLLCNVEIGDEDEEYVSELAKRECLEVKTTSLHDSASRKTAIDWILKTGAKFGFRNQTSYLAISYFDLLISGSFINESETWAIQASSIACLSVAAKMEEIITPKLSQFPQEDFDFNFKSSLIRKMELFILQTLNWKMNLITPFNYIHYFVSKFSQTHQSSVASRSSESLLSLTKEMCFTDHLQFVVAAATVFSSLDCEKLTKEEIEIKLDSITWWISSENGNVFLIYEKLQKMKQRMSESMVSSESCIATKRRSSFDDSDQSFSSFSSKERKLI